MEPLPPKLESRMNSTIPVDELRVGMYIHLDGGWLSHPFPLSAFRISTSAEILALRRLGVTQVRWSPEKSDIAAPVVVPRLPPTAPSRPLAPTESTDMAMEQRSQWLADQRASAQRCERQFGEAARAWREAWEQAAPRPADAGRRAESLTQAMLEEMKGTEDIGIRLVNGGGDRAAAHALNVAVISMLIGRTLGLAEQDMLDLGVGAMLHDIGKIDLPDRLRHEDEGFTPAEMSGYRDHVAKGVMQGQRMALTPGVLAVIGQHHEHADGSGFPLRLPAERQSLAARIVGLVNRYDRLCNPPLRSRAMTPHEAVAMLFAHSRGRHDPTVLNAFIRMMGVYPAGSLVQLTDERYALVVGVNSSRPLKPRVLVYGAPLPAARGRQTGAETQLIDLEHQPDIGIRRSLPAAKLPPAVLAALDPRPRVVCFFEPLLRQAQPEAQPS